MNTLIKMVATMLIAATSTSAVAQDYPTRPIRMIVPLTPGSGADIAGRIVAKHLGDAWKQPVIVENRPGAGGQIGTQAVVKAEPDGYTLLVQSASHAANSAIYKTPALRPAQGSRRRRDPRHHALRDGHRAKGGAYRDAQGAGRRGQGEARRDPLRLGGRRQLDPPRGGVLRPGRGREDAAHPVQGLARGDPGHDRRAHVLLHGADQHRGRARSRTGRLAALGVSTRQRADVLPDVPPLAEQGLADFDISLWFGMWAPAGTPPAVVQKLNAQVARDPAEAPEVREQFAKLGITPAPMKPEEFAQLRARADRHLPARSSSRPTSSRSSDSEASRRN